MKEPTPRHYEEVSAKACSWYSTIPRAIRFWYLEKPKLERENAELRAALERSLNWLSSYPGEGALGAYEQARAALENRT